MTVNGACITAKPIRGRCFLQALVKSIASKAKWAELGKFSSKRVNFGDFEAIWKAASVVALWHKRELFLNLLHKKINNKIVNIKSRFFQVTMVVLYVSEIRVCYLHLLLCEKRKKTSNILRWLGR